MKKGEIIKELVAHYSRTASCKDCFIKKECSVDFQSISDCERKMKLKLVEAEK